MNDSKITTRGMHSTVMEVAAQRARLRSAAGGGEELGSARDCQTGCFCLALAVLIFLALGKYYPGSGAEQVDWRPTRGPELEPALELHDVEQMIEAQNARGAALPAREELTEEELRAKVEDGERWRREQAAR